MGSSGNIPGEWGGGGGGGGGVSGWKIPWKLCASWSCLQYIVNEENTPPRIPNLILRGKKGQNLQP